MKLIIERLRIIDIITISIVFLSLIIAGLFFHNKDIDQVSYNGRTYNICSLQKIEGNLKMVFDTTKPTGKYCKGMEIYDLENNPFDSIVIFLKTRDGEFLTYELSGGP